MAHGNQKNCPEAIRRISFHQRERAFRFFLGQLVPGHPGQSDGHVEPRLRDVRGPEITSLEHCPLFGSSEIGEAGFQLASFDEFHTQLT